MAASLVRSKAPNGDSPDKWLYRRLEVHREDISNVVELRDREVYSPIAAARQNYVLIRKSCPTRPPEMRENVELIVLPMITRES